MKTNDGKLTIGEASAVSPTAYDVSATDGFGGTYTLRVNSDDPDRVITHAATEPLDRWTRLS